MQLCESHLNLQTRLGHLHITPQPQTSIYKHIITMAFLPRRIPSSVLRPQPRAILYLQTRAISLTPRRPLKEDADRSPEQIENMKQEQIEKQKQGKGHWHEELASAGETAVKA